MRRLARLKQRELGGWTSQRPTSWKQRENGFIEKAAGHFRGHKVESSVWWEEEAELHSSTKAESAERARCAHQRGKVLFLSRPMRFLLMVVEHGTASRWWELLGRVGTH